MNIEFIVVKFNPFPYRLFCLLKSVEVADPDAFFLDCPHDPFGIGVTLGIVVGCKYLWSMPKIFMSFMKLHEVG